MKRLNRGLKKNKKSNYVNSAPNTEKIEKKKC